MQGRPANPFIKPALILITVVLLIAGIAAMVTSGKQTLKPSPRKVKPIKFVDAIAAESKTLDSFFTHLNKINQFNGSVLIARNDTILFRKSFGWADVPKKISLTDSSRFQLASVSKPITATAILILVENGKLNLDSPVKNYLPDFPYDSIRLKHLLQHTSGLQDYTKVDAKTFPFADSLLSNENVLQWLAIKKPQPWFLPGKRFNYCNTNYALLALIIEKKSGQNYFDFIAENIFQPLGMTGAGRLDLSTFGHNYGGTTVANDVYDQVYGDKGVYATSLDLYKFSRAWKDGSLIGKELHRQAIEDTIYARQKDKFYGYGWRIAYDDSGRKIVYHNGWWHGYRTAFNRRLKDDVTVIMLSNKLNSNFYRTIKSVFNIMDHKDPNLDKQTDEEM